MGSKFACSTCSVIRGCEHSLALLDHGCNAKLLSVEGKRGPVQEKARSFPLVSGREVCSFSSLLHCQLCACVYVCVCLCVCVCVCPVVPRPSAQAASEPWPRLVTAQLQTPRGTPLCCQPHAGRGALTTLYVPTYKPHLPVLWDTHSCCRGTRVSSGRGHQWTSVPAHTIPVSSMVNPLPSLPFLGCLPDLGHLRSFSIFIATFIPLFHNFFFCLFVS